MSDAKPRAKVAPKQEVHTPFKQMQTTQKVIHIVQVVVCLCTFGFVFPNSIGANDTQV